MSGKKIFSLDVPMDEDMFKALHGFAAADGIKTTELARMLFDSYIEDRRAYYARLTSIFGDKPDKRQSELIGSDQVFDPPSI